MEGIHAGIRQVGNWVGWLLHETNYSADGIDHCSSNNSTTCAIQSIAVPVLFAGMGAFVFVRDNEVFFELAKSRDKELIYIEGANHGFTGCKPCETVPGQYQNSFRNFFDYVAKWIDARF